MQRELENITDNLLTTIIEQSADAIYSIDVNGIVASWNAGAEKIFGFAGDDVIGTPVTRFVPANRHAEHATIVRTVLRGGVVEPYETLRQAKGGQFIEVSITASPIQDRNGRIIGVSEMARDLSIMKRSEREIERLSRLHLALLNINRTIISLPTRTELLNKVCQYLVTDAEFSMSWVGWHDSAAHRLVPVAEYGDRNHLLKAIRIGTDRSPDGQGPTGTAFRENRPYVCNNLVDDPQAQYWRTELDRCGLRAAATFPICRRGAPVGVLSVYSENPIFFADREIALLTEVTNSIAFALDNLTREELRERAEQEAAQDRLTLVRAMRIATMGELVATISHEIKQPLTAIAANSAAAVRWLADESPNLPEARETLKHIIHDIKRATDIIQRVRSMATSNEPVRAAFDLNQAIEEILHLTRREQKAAEVTLQISLRPALPSFVGDRVQFQQVILNLVTNALDAMKCTSGRPRLLRIWSGISDSGEIQVGVEDTGTGLDPAIQGRIFEKFRTTKPKGMGLGLSISRSIVEAHGGRLWATAGVPHGTTFHISLPQT